MLNRVQPCQHFPPLLRWGNTLAQYSPLTRSAGGAFQAFNRPSSASIPKADLLSGHSQAGGLAQTFTAGGHHPLLSLNPAIPVIPQDSPVQTSKPDSKPAEKNMPENRMLPPFRIKPPMIWDAIVYGLMGATLGAKHKVPAIAMGVGAGVGMNYGFDILGKISEKGQANLVENWEEQKHKSVQPALWLPPLLYSAITVLRGFWFLDKIDRYPTQSFSKMQAMENVFLNKDLLAKLKLHMTNPGKKLSWREKWKIMMDFLESSKVQEGTLGLKGAHETSLNFVHWMFQDALHLDKLLPAFNEPIKSALTFLMETFRGLPVTRAMAPWLENQEQKTMPILRKMGKASTPLAGDILWLTTVLLSWNVLVKGAYQKLKDWASPPALAPDEWVVRT